MAIRNLDKIFHPHNIAVIGASEQPSSVGRTVMRNLLDAGFEGSVFPVNPKYESVFDKQAFANVSELPDGVDLAVVCTPAHTVPDIVRQCGQAGIMGLVVISAGFREAGDEGKQLESQIDEARRKFDGMRIVGPNCLGVMAPHGKLNASFADAMPPAGRLAFISQSGALCTSVLDWALKEGVGFSYFVSIGNMLDVSIGDLIDYCASGETTDAVILYVESIQGARQFMSAARAFAREKPIVAYKAGRFEESAQAAASHTGAMAGVDDVYQAAFNRAGIVRVFELDDLFDCAELLARHAQYLANQIVMLGGTPKLEPDLTPPPVDVREMLECDAEQERKDVTNYTRLAGLAEKEGHFALKLQLEEQAADEDRHGQEMIRLLG